MLEIHDSEQELSCACGARPTFLCLCQYCPANPRTTGRDRGSQAQVKTFLVMRMQADLNVAQTLATRELRQRHAQELIDAGKAFHVTITVIALHQPTKRVPRQLLHELREDVLTLMHGSHSRGQVARLRVSQLKSMTHLNRR